MTRQRRKTLLFVGLPVLVCAGAAGLLGALLRPAPLVPAPAFQASSPAPAVTVQSAAASPASADAMLAVVAAQPEEKHYEPLPPLPPGTTTTDLMNTYVDEVCACPDMACVADARERHNRYFGLAAPVRGIVDRRAAFARATSCIQEIKDGEGG